MPLRDVPLEPEGWTVTTFPSPPGTVARVAVEGDAVVHVEAWMPPGGRPPPRRSAPGPSTSSAAPRSASVFAAGLLGLRDALEPERDDKVAIVQDYSGAPPFTDPIVLRLDPEHPEDSIVMVRPWLRDPPAPEPPDEDAQASAVTPAIAGRSCSARACRAGA